MITIQRYGRFWKVEDGSDIVAVTVYKKGALEGKRLLDLAEERCSPWRYRHDF